jgi:hypothetical protein
LTNRTNAPEPILNLLARLDWSEWIPFSEDRTRLKGLPKASGIYQIRQAASDTLCYIGETGRDLRERLSSALKGVLGDTMPYNDPHTAAPGLWCYRQEGYDFECRVAHIELSTRDRRSLETLLIWQHRLQHGESPLCNLGRFHSRYTKSGSRKSGERGQALRDTDKSNPAGDSSAKPLKPSGDAFGEDWMGLTWTPFFELRESDPPPTAGLYRIAVNGSIAYIGESTSLETRVIAHRRRDWNGVAKISHWQFEGHPPHHHRLELENDLIAGHILQKGEAPVHQYGG